MSEIKSSQFYALMDIFSPFAEGFANAKSTGNAQKRADTLGEFADKAQAWSASAGPLAPIALEIFKDAEFKKRFREMMKFVLKTKTAGEVIHQSVLDLLAEVERLDEPEAMLKTLEKRCEDAVVAREQAKKAWDRAVEAEFQAAEEFKQHKQKLAALRPAAISA